MCIQMCVKVDSISHNKYLYFEYMYFATIENLSGEKWLAEILFDILESSNIFVSHLMYCYSSCGQVCHPLSCSFW